MLVPWQDDGGRRRARRARAAAPRAPSSSPATAAPACRPTCCRSRCSRCRTTRLVVDRRGDGAARARRRPRRPARPRLLAARAAAGAPAAAPGRTWPTWWRNSAARSFPAATHFPALPPAGPLPPGSIDPRDFTQRYFPAEVDVDFTHRSRTTSCRRWSRTRWRCRRSTWPPAARSTRTAVMVSRRCRATNGARWWRGSSRRVRTLGRRRRTWWRSASRSRSCSGCACRCACRLLDVSNPSDAEWQRLARLPTLWFVRRRQLASATTTPAPGRPSPASTSARSRRDLRVRLAGLGLGAAVRRLVSRTSPAAASTLTQLLAAPRFAESPALTAAAIGSLTEAARGQQRRRPPPAEPGRRRRNASPRGDDACRTPRCSRSPPSFGAPAPASASSASSAAPAPHRSAPRRCSRLASGSDWTRARRAPPGPAPRCRGSRRRRCGSAASPRSGGSAQPRSSRLPARWHRDAPQPIAQRRPTALRQGEASSSTAERSARCTARPS